MSPDEQVIAGGDYEGNIFVWDATTGRERWTVKEHACDGLAFSPDGKLIASANEDKTIKVFDAKNGHVRHTVGPLNARVRKVMFSPDGRWIASAGGGGADDRR